jgi:energy-converting hydrogenase A subunit M
MPENEMKIAVKNRLKAFFDIIYEEAVKNPDFFSKIEAVLISEEINISKENSTEINKKPDYNLISILHADGEVALYKFLGSKTNDDLVKMCSKDKIAKPKEAKLLQREILIQLVIDTIKNRLKQGESFIR